MKDISILELCESYPDNEGGIGLSFVHIRNLEYIKNGISVDVLNFGAKKCYVREGIRVVTLTTFEEEKKNYDLLIMHAPNLRHHYIFLLKHGKKFKNIISFFHGHEVLKTNLIYPKPYKFVKVSPVKQALKNVYDTVKIRVWTNYFEKHKNTRMVFVSQWLKNQYLSQIKKYSFTDRISVINNGVGHQFIEKQYDKEAEKQYDFISVRSVLDGAKYCVDLYVELAKKYPEYNFLLIGKGRFFDYYEKPQNLVWINTYLSHDELVSYIDRSRCAIMLTRQDTQGVMTCEFAEYGIPTISSDIDVCVEMLSQFHHVKLVKNDVAQIDLPTVYDSLLKAKANKVSKFYPENTSDKEIELIKSVIKS